MSQIEVKQVISSFCSILEWFDFSKITAEDFRQAKFNKPEVVKKLWRLLFELIFYLDNSKKSGFKKLKQELIVAYFDRETPENVCKYLKAKLIELCYPNDDFYQLEESFSADNSSRELLLAIGWLIATYQITDIFVRNSTCFNDDEHLTDTKSQNENIEKIRQEADKNHQEYKSKEETDYLGRLNYLKWLNGVFRFKLNSFYSCQLEKARLENKAHLVTKSANSSHFSCSELYLLKHPQLIDKYEKILLKNNELKTHILTWLRYEDLFWKWMESVFEEKSNQGRMRLDEFKTSSSENKDFNVVIAKNVQDKLKNSIEAERKFHESLNRLEKFELSMKEKLIQLDRGEIDEFSQSNLVKFRSYESGLNVKFENILNCQFLNDLKDRKSTDYLNLELVDSGRLRLVNKKGAKVDTDELSINRKTAILKQEFSLLEKLYQDDKKRAWAKCKLISSKLDDCYVIYNK